MTTPTPALPVHDAPGLDTLRVGELYRLGRLAYVASPVYAGILMVVLWQPLWVGALLGWYAALIGVTAARVLVHAAYVRQRPAASALGWERRYALGAFAAGAVWSGAPALFFAPDSSLLQMALLLVIGGSLVGAVGLYATSTRTVYAYCLPPLIAVIGELLRQADADFRLLALAMLLFGAMLARVHRELHDSVVGNLRARHEHDALRAVAQAAAERLGDAIEHLPGAVAVWDEHDRLVACNAAYARDYGAGRTANALAGAAYRDIALAAFALEARDAPGENPRASWGGAREGWVAAREAWIEARRGERDGAAGAPAIVHTRDGRWLQRRMARTGLGGHVETVADVTDLRRAHDAYTALLDKEAQLLDTLPLGIAFVEDGTITRCNGRLAQMLDTTPRSLAGTSLGQVCGDDAQARAALDTLSQRVAREGRAEGDLRLRRRDGAPVWCQVFARGHLADALPASVIYAFADAEERMAMLQALQGRETTYRNLVETSNDLIWSLDAEGCWTYLNAGAVERIYGCTPGEMLGRPLEEVLVPQVRERDLLVFGRLLHGSPVFEFETRHRRRDGGVVDLSFNAVPLRDSAGSVVGSTGTARDVSEQKRAAAVLYDTVEKLRLALETAGLNYWEWEVEPNVLRYGREPGGAGTAGDAKAVPVTDYMQRVHPEDRDRVRAAGAAAAERGAALYCEFRLVRRDGSVRWVLARGRPVFDPGGQIVRVSGVAQDISDRKRSEDEARFLAHHDALTGLPNRRLLDDRLNQAVYLAQRRDTRVAVMVVDLDGFKQVNDALGHRAGDTVLREASQRLAGCVRRADTLARQGGDEFVVVMADMRDNADCEFVAHKILAAFGPPFRVEARDFQLGASIGISVYPLDANDREALLRNADAAMYRAKQLGRNHYRFYAH